MIYLLIGAGIFIWCESDFEDKKCEQAKAALILKTQSFGNMYFYELGMNRKLCTGNYQFKKCYLELLRLK